MLNISVLTKLIHWILKLSKYLIMFMIYSKTHFVCKICFIIIIIIIIIIINIIIIIILWSFQNKKKTCSFIFTLGIHCATFLTNLPPKNWKMDKSKIYVQWYTDGYSTYLWGFLCSSDNSNWMLTPFQIPLCIMYFHTSWVSFVVCSYIVTRKHRHKNVYTQTLILDSCKTK